MSDIREQKLSAVSYPSTTMVRKMRTGELKPISKYLAAQNLKITIPMLKKCISRI